MVELYAADDTPDETTGVTDAEEAALAKGQELTTPGTQKKDPPESTSDKPKDDEKPNEEDEAA